MSPTQESTLALLRGLRRRFFYIQNLCGPAYRNVRNVNVGASYHRWMGAMRETTLAMLRYGNDGSPTVEYGFNGGVMTQFELDVFFNG